MITLTTNKGTIDIYSNILTVIDNGKQRLVCIEGVLEPIPVKETREEINEKILESYEIATITN